MSKIHFHLPILMCLIFGILQASDGPLDCFQQPATATTNYADATAYNAFSCPNNVAQCYKYVCVGRVYYVQRGCNDPRSPTQNCQVVQGQCHAQGGSGACYTCTGDRCNSAISKIGIGWHWLVALNLLFLFGGLNSDFKYLFFKL